MKDGQRTSFEIDSVVPMQSPGADHEAPDSKPWVIDELHVQEQARQFKMHMDSMIRRSCDDLQRSLEILCHEYLDLEVAPGEPAKGEAVYANGSQQYANGSQQASGTPCLFDASSTFPSEGFEDNALRKSKSNIMKHQSTQFEEHLIHEKAAMLKMAVQNAEDVEAKIQGKVGKDGKPQHQVWWWSLYDMSLRDLFLEPIMGFTIILNVICIGIAMDADTDSAAPIMMDIAFCTMFSIELALNLTSEGPKKYFYGKNMLVNWFNAVLVVFDILSIVLYFNDADDELRPEGAPSPSLLRAVRVMRLARILRMLKWPIFSDLIAMMQGLVAGMSTLLWSMVLFFCTIYVFALVFREALGRDSREHVMPMFDSVPRSIYTTFRCSFGDCSAPGGVPIFEHVQDFHGWVWSMVYCTFTYLVVIGLFNVISAIFVEATMRSATALDLRTKQERLQNDDLWSVQVKCLIRHLVRRHPPEPEELFSYSWDEHCCMSIRDKLHEVRVEDYGDIPDDEWIERLLLLDNQGHPVDLLCVAQADLLATVFPLTANLHPPMKFRVIQERSDEETIPLSEEIYEISKLSYGPKAIDKWVQHPRVIHALDELDIDRQDHGRLSDILDPQNDGQVPVLDLIDGIRRLRGFARRSDIVCIDLMIRESQKTSQSHHKDIQSVQKCTEEMQEQMEGLKVQLQHIESALRSKKKS
jgi:hypothetical protein